MDNHIFTQEVTHKPPSNWVLVFFHIDWEMTFPSSDWMIASPGSYRIMRSKRTGLRIWRKETVEYRKRYGYEN